MTKRYAGTTLTYDVRADIYLRTEVYESEDPGGTAELRIIEPESDKTPKTQRRGATFSKQHNKRPTEPLVLRAEDRKIERDPAQQKAESRVRRNTRVLPSQRTNTSAHGRPQMVVSDRSDPSDGIDNKKTSPPTPERTLDGIPFASRDDV